MGLCEEAWKIGLRARVRLALEGGVLGDHVPCARDDPFATRLATARADARQHKQPRPRPAGAGRHR